MSFIANTNSNFISNMSDIGAIFFSFGVLIFLVSFVAPTIVVFVRFLLDCAAAKRAKVKIPRLGKRLKEYFVSRKYVLAFSFLGLLIAVVWALLFSLGFWALLSGIPIIIIILAILTEGRLIRQGRSHSTEMSGRLCICGDEMRNVFINRANLLACKGKFATASKI